MAPHTCTWCGAPLPKNWQRTVCGDCVPVTDTNDEAGQRASEVREVRATLIEVGLDPQTRVHRIRFSYERPNAVVELAVLRGGTVTIDRCERAPSTSASGLGGYLVSVYGVLPLFDFGSPPPPHFQWDDASEPMTLQTLRFTVRHGTSPVYLEKRWRPGGVETVTLCGLEHKHTESDRTRAWGGLRHLRYAQWPGKTAFLEAEGEFRAHLKRAMDAVYPNDHSLPARMVAKVFGLSYSQFFKRFEGYPFTYEQEKERYLTARLTAKLKRPA